MVKLKQMCVFSVALAAQTSLASELTSELTEADFLYGGSAVLTASRLAQPLMDTPNAITVLERDLIEASGYHNISDLFRLIPGMYVGQAKGWFHNVSHTLADEYARRMQVLVDGASVYLPSIGGVRWDALPLSIDDIERIEVVRGSNAATFGSNSFTGVINIITRHPEDVDGKMLHVTTGDHGHREGWFRWAGLSESASHRLTVGHREDGGFGGQYDDERSRILNYRSNIELPGRQVLDVQMGYLDGTRGAGSSSKPEDQPREGDVTSYSAQVDYRRPLSGTSEILAKMYFNHLETLDTVPVALFGATHYRVDLQSQRWHAEMQLNQDHGAGVRSSLGGFVRGDSVSSEHYFATAEDLSAGSRGVFGHLEWRLAPTWLLNAGTFWEDYDLVGARWSPRISLNWQPSPRHTVRMGVSQAYRNPVLFETDADWRLTLLAANGASVVTSNPYVLASGGVAPEEILSGEISYMGVWPEKGVSVDARLFREHLTHFISAECPTGADCTGLSPSTPRDFFNIGDTWQEGMEFQLKWYPQPRTQVVLNYAFLHIDSRFDEQRYSPPYLVGLHVMHQFPGRIGLMVSHYWTGAFEPIGQRALSSSRRLDMHLSRQFDLGEQRAEISLGVENAGNQSYYEFSDSSENLFDTRAYVHFKVDF